MKTHEMLIFDYGISFPFYLVKLIEFILIFNKNIMCGGLCHNLIKGHLKNIYRSVCLFDLNAYPMKTRLTSN